jgi:PBP1b-binding outer membrane lipoprotein LpoB
MIELSEFCIIIYIARNFMIRELCFLDSDFIKRKFSGKGHVVFLKEVDISDYFFSKSEKHIDKVVNSSALLKYSSPTLAMKLAEKFSTTTDDD